VAVVLSPSLDINITNDFAAGPAAKKPANISVNRLGWRSWKIDDSAADPARLSVSGYGERGIQNIGSGLSLDFKGRNCATEI